MHVYEIEYKCQINIHETLVTGRPKWEFGLNHNIISFMYFSSLFIKKTVLSKLEMKKVVVSPFKLDERNLCYCFT